MPQIKICGKARLMLFRKGIWQWTREERNLVVSAGRDLLASIVGASGTKPSHMACGSSGTATSDSMTALQGTEHERVALSSTAVLGNTVTYNADFGATLGGAVTVQEFAILNAAAAGTMLARFITESFTLNPTDTLDVDWALTFGD